MVKFRENDKKVKDMSLESVKAHFRKWQREGDIMEFTSSSATVEEAAETIGVVPARIAKTLSFKGKDDQTLLVVTSGDAKIDNKKFRQTFGFKARMLTAEEVVERTGHVVGGVCPFGLKTDCGIYLDVSLKRFSSVFPACGNTHSAIELTPSELELFSQATGWVDVCKDWRNETVPETDPHMSEGQYIK
jgi:prolyl-tRNA editing enzyme YbaK/EbsC (Cys-tRNA(Pro) deacylase)